MNKPYRPSYVRDRIRKDPSFGEVIHVLKDGMGIMIAHHMDANVEVQGFCIFNGIEYRRATVGATLTKDGKVIPPKEFELSIKRLLTPCASTSRESCDAAVAKYVSKHFKFQKSKCTFTPREEVMVKAGEKTFKQIARENFQKGLPGCLVYLQGRQDGWLLLGTSDEKELAKMVRVSFGRKAVNQMRETRRLPCPMVQKLVARKNQIHYSPLPVGEAGNQKPVKKFR